MGEHDQHIATMLVWARCRDCMASLTDDERRSVVWDRSGVTWVARELLAVAPVKPKPLRRKFFKP